MPRRDRRRTEDRRADLEAQLVQRRPGDAGAHPAWTSGTRAPRSAARRRPGELPPQSGEDLLGLGDAVEELARLAPAVRGVGVRGLSPDFSPGGYKATEDAHRTDSSLEALMNFRRNVPALGFSLMLLLTLGCVSEKAGNVVTLPQIVVDSPVLDLAVSLVSPELVREASDAARWEGLVAAARRAEIGEYPFSVYLGLTPGRLKSARTGEPALILSFDTEHPDYVELLSSSGVEAAADGVYSVLSLVFIDQMEDCSIVRTAEVSAAIVDEHKSKSLKGGCCAVLAVAHSLVRKMGVIVRPEDATKDTDGDRKPDEWDPEFLKKVRKASGDDDNGKGLTDEEVKRAHEADWNDSWKVGQVDDDVELFDDEDVTCAVLKQRCDKLAERLRTNDDLTLRIRGKDGKKGDEWGHRVPIEAAGYTAGPPCCCTIEITRTSVQEPKGKPDFTGIPYNPGKAMYRTCTDAAGKTTVTNTEFPGSIIRKLVYDSFDEAPKRRGVKATDQGRPGSALQ
jgi:hypothetical protein